MYAMSIQCQRRSRVRSALGIRQSKAERDACRSARASDPGVRQVRTTSSFVRNMPAMEIGGEGAALSCLLA